MARTMGRIHQVLLESGAGARLVPPSFLSLVDGMGRSVPKWDEAAFA